jgi:DNA mismatch repair ATPase MutS
MNPLLMHRDKSFDPNLALPWNAEDLTKDLALNVLFEAMARGDPFVLEVARKAVLSGVAIDADTILFRQEVLKDCLDNSSIIRRLYRLTLEAVEIPRRQWWGLASKYPPALLHSSIEMLEHLVGALKILRQTAEESASLFKSAGFATMFAMIAAELTDDYLAAIQSHLALSRFREGVLITAQLGNNNESSNLVLRKPPEDKRNWWKRLLRKGPPGYTFQIPERDEAGSRIVGETRDQAISRVAIALAQSSDHVLNFFKTLQTELAFYIGCINLREALTARGGLVCFPNPLPTGTRMQRYTGLYDVCLSLQSSNQVVGSSADADGKSMVIITGANQGGKSTFLRSVGLAQLMMQSGLFVGAQNFEAELVPAVLTHYKREEDQTMKSGKLDEELSRISAIVDHIVPDSLLLLNESFAATNEREGSEIARQIVCAMRETEIKIFYVTHLYEFARGLFDRESKEILFLRAERRDDGTRTFRMVEGEPLETSYGEDLYDQLFLPHDNSAGGPNDSAN